MLALLDVEMPKGMQADGLNLVEVLDGNTASREQAFIKQGVRGPRFKVLFRTADAILLGEKTPSVDSLSGSLFDLQTDPLERSNLWSRQPKTVERLLGLYREEMVRPYARYVAAHGSEQPTLAFAVSARYFSTSPLATMRSLEETDSDPDRQWEQYAHWSDSYLLARQGATPIEIEFPLPNGEYQMSVAISGEAILQVGRNGTKVPVRGRSLRVESLPPDTAPTDESDYGTIEVREERFRVTIKPHTRESPVLIRYIGFKPVHEGQASDPEEEQSHLDRLKALGYVN